MAEEHKPFFRVMKAIKNEVIPYKTNLKKIRIGGANDGGYVICDGIQSDGLYSYGSENNIKFEKAFHQKYGKDCWVYDHTIEGITDKPDYVHFFKQGVSNRMTAELDTIDNQVARNGHTDCSKMFAQIDIEGYEWISLTVSEKIKEFAQVLLEFHVPTDNIMQAAGFILETLTFLNKYFICVHVHGNNCPLRPWADHNLPGVFECTYVRRDLVKTHEIDYQEYPINGLDLPNSPDRPDLPLNWWHHNKAGYGKVYGRFFLGPHLGIEGDDTPDTFTLSELVETFESWAEVVKRVPWRVKQLFTMFETSDVHPDIIKAMRVFDRVIVPFDYLKTILVRNGLDNVTSLNFYTSDLIMSKPTIIPKTIDEKSKVFLYVGTNDLRKSVTKLTRVFAKASEGTNHKLIVKTNNDNDLTITPNITCITDKISLEKLAGLYNICDYVISFTHGEGVGLPMVEASYFNKPVIAHGKGVFEDIIDFVKVPWHILPSKEVPIDLEKVPDYLKKVFYKSWWEVDEEGALEVIKNILN
jgi:glycosyltransferase involved in cell wall biosynthesis